MYTLKVTHGRKNLRTGFRLCVSIHQFVWYTIKRNKRSMDLVLGDLLDGTVSILRLVEFAKMLLDTTFETSALNDPKMTLITRK